MKGAAGWALAALAVYLLITRPSYAAGLVTAAFGLLGDVADSAIQFLGALG